MRLRLTIMTVSPIKVLLTQATSAMSPITDALYWRYSRYVILRGIGPKFFADVHNSAMHEHRSRRAAPLYYMGCIFSSLLDLLDYIINPPALGYTTPRRFVSEIQRTATAHLMFER